MTSLTLAQSYLKKAQMRSWSVHMRLSNPPALEAEKHPIL